MTTPEGEVVRARGVCPRPEGTKVEESEVSQIKGQPWAPKGVVEMTDLGPRKLVASDIPTQEQPRPDGPKPRGFRIEAKVLRDHGFTIGCPKCSAMRRKDAEHHTVHHTPACRERLREAMMKDEKYDSPCERKRRSEWGLVD